MNSNWLRQVIETPELQGMGHSQSLEDLNLGFGWVYYGLARAYRPKHVVCIGSYRGFVPMMFARALRDTGAGGQVTFIDPSFVDDFWKTPSQVEDWFEQYDVPNIHHHQMTTQEFKASGLIQDLPPVDFLYVDGYHSEDQARFDHETFLPHMNENGLVFFHDSVTRKMSDIYGTDGAYPYSVCDYISTLAAQDNMQVIDFPFEDGLTLVRKTTASEKPMS
ncbi:MAG: class I SAM-dependent methyltransferase [Marivita sp.]|uniref:class I SAM-dependent methyltransferase n=1 Tax=Marivita sp. TaxID=2003365 RepID=UPI003EF6C0A2